MSETTTDHLYTRGLPAFLEYFAEDGAAVTVLGHDRAVPSSMSELMLTFLDGHARRAGDGHRRAGVLGDELELTPSERMYRRRQEQVGLRAERVGGHHLTSVCQVPATSRDNFYSCTCILRVSGVARRGFGGSTPH